MKKGALNEKGGSTPDYYDFVTSSLFLRKKMIYVRVINGFYVALCNDRNEEELFSSNKGGIISQQKGIQFFW